jgi:phage terminase large subunit-like protein
MKSNSTKSKSATSADRTEAYAVAVTSGKIVAGPHVRNACLRHLKDLADGGDRGLHFDRAAESHAIGFFEDMLRLSGGQFDGRPFLLAPSQAFIVGSIFGWKRANGKRRFRSAFIEQGKGNGKSPLAAGIGLYGLTADGESAAEIYPLASHREQAMVLFRDAVSMVKQSPKLKRRLHLSGGEGREHNIANFATGGWMRPLTREANRTGSGPRPHMGLADEIHELINRSALDMLEAGFKSREQPLLLMITNSGTDRNSIAWEKHEHAIKVAAGNIDAETDPTFIGDPIDDEFFSYVCALDKGDDPLNDPSCWIKANPLLGVILTEEYLAGIVAQAKALPGMLNGKLRLNFCVWTDAEEAWMTRQTLEPCIADFDPKEHFGKQVSIGLDLSMTRDLTAMAAVVQTGEVEVPALIEGETVIVRKPTFDAWVEAWTPADTLAARALKDKADYLIKWVQQGHLHAPAGSVISFIHVAQTLAEWDQNYDIQLVAYDRYAFKKFEETAASLSLDIPFVEHPQAGVRKGAKIEGTDIQLWMPESLRELESALLERRLRLRRNPVLISAMMSAVNDGDKWGNRWLAKQKSANKIDAAVALCMAMGGATMLDSGPRQSIDDYLAMAAKYA